MLDNEIIINGEKLKILFTFSKNDKNYVVYEEKDSSISASIYTYNNNNKKLTLTPIETEEEWDQVDAMVSEMSK